MSGVADAFSGNHAGENMVVWSMEDCVSTRDLDVTFGGREQS